MRRITGGNLVSFINQLPKNIDYNYINPKTKGLIRIVRVVLPEGPVVVKRWNPSAGESANSVDEVSISTEMIWRVANAFAEDQPINIDRILGASYNTRSVLESLLAHVPQFYYCYPGRISDIAGRSTIENGHKHLVWKPNMPHENGILSRIEVDIAISEIPISAAIYDSLIVPDTSASHEIDININRRHAQIQIALYLIGKQLGYRTWIAQNDRGLIYQNQPINEQQGIVQSLNDEGLVGPFDGAVEAGLFIDCIWFKNGRLMPAVLEVEHTTGITSGLTRMKNFYDRIPRIQTRFVIVAPDDDRDKVILEANKTMFRDMDVKFFPYSAVEELYSICQRRKIRGIQEEFLDCFMENVVC